MSDSKSQCDVLTFAGPKTVFFWGPMMKWCLVAAGVKDLQRPPEKLSVSQNLGACDWLWFSLRRVLTVLCFSIAPRCHNIPIHLD